MSTHNICFNKRYIQKCGCNMKTTKLLDCALIGVCAVIRSNTVVPLKGHLRLREKPRLNFDTGNLYLF